MSRSLDAIKHLAQPPAPKDWTPGVTFDGNEGWVTTTAEPGKEPSKDQIDQIIRTSNLDPDEITVDWNAKPRISTHIGPDGELLQAWYKFGIQKRPEREFDVEDILESIYGEFEPIDRSDVPYWRNVVISDQHIGKSEEDGGGTETLIERWKQGVGISLGGDRTWGGVNIILPGDIVEGYVSQNGKGIGSCDLTLTEQIRVANHLVSWTIQEALDCAPFINVVVCGGNHGESTRQAQVSMTDNYDIQVVNNVQQAMELAGLSDRVSFYYPAPNTGDVTWTAGDTTFTVVHGHKFSGGAVNGAEKWFAGQITNDRPAKDSNIMIFGHFHGYRSWSYTANRWIMSAPALETQSTWFANQTGATSKPGVLCFDTAESRPWNINVV